MTDEPLATWVCVCGEKREVPYKYTGDGKPACPKCREPMNRQGEKSDKEA